MRCALIPSVFFAVICPAGSVSLVQQKPEIPVTDQNVEKAIAKAVEYVFSRQRDDGSWPPFEEGQPPRQLIYKEGPTAMSIYALVAGGVPAKDPRITKALEWMARPDNQCKLTYSIAFRCLAWLTVNKQLENRFMKQLTADVEALAKAGKNGTYTYSIDGGGWDNSNTQYGLYGVWAGAMGGVEVTKDYWDKSLNTTARLRLKRRRW